VNGGEAQQRGRRGTKWRPFYRSVAAAANFFDVDLVI
jgi:hypothetical protein